MLVSSIINWAEPVCLLSGPSSQHSLHHTNMQSGGNAWVTECSQWLKQMEEETEEGPKKVKGIQREKKREF